MRRFIFAFLFALAPLAAFAANDKPLVIINGQTRQIPSGDNIQIPSISGSTQCVHADTSGNLTGTGSDCGTGSGSGTVSSVGMTGDGTVYNSVIPGSPVTTAGTLAPSLHTQSPNTALMGPTTGSAAAPTFRQPAEADLSTSDITTNNVSITKHGFAPKAPNDASKYLDGTGGYSVPPGTGAPTTDSSLDLTYFGTGIDGNVTVASGVTLLARDMYYANLTLNGTGQICPGSWKIFVSGVLDISAAPASAITSCSSGGGSKNGSASASGSGGGGQSSIGGHAVGQGNGSSSGAAGTTGVGAQASAGASTGNSLPNISGTAGKGGAASNAGGAAKAGPTGSLTNDLRILTTFFGIQTAAANFIQVNGGSGGVGGSSGGGDGTSQGGGGGGGGLGGEPIAIFARTINRSSSTTVAAINADGGNGGAGGPGQGATNSGGGGGGSGGAGGWLYIVTRILTGTSGTNILSATAGNGGTGGNGHGTGGGGDGGGAGSKGRIDLFNLGTGTWTHAESDTTVVAGTAASGTTGGAGATANAQQLSL